MDLDAAVTEQVRKLLERLESYLPKDWGVMCWVYSREIEQLDVQAFTSHETLSETLRLVRATTSQLVRNEARAGRLDAETWYEAPAEPGTARSDLFISSASVVAIGGHDHVRVWTRGALAGELVLDGGEGELLARRLGLRREQPEAP